ncbi:membrane protein [Hydrobacter penzbergensis]|uniref:Membrane protein n=1 Tax=Hydrobacter penzbergensis TaxID=1235997 RepID=A0A8X8IEW0_9BACT|nr:YihY/virulence factor BrkB family protein [Hydrobacter penzbergensis]SDX41890.1 membrane protein [Hydrobacter penzbergensis]
MTKIERHIVNLAPIAWLINKSKTLVIPGFRGLPLYDVVRFFFRQINKVGLNERAAAISFNFIMAMPAALLFLFALVPYFPASASFETEILKLFKDISPDSATYRFIKDILDGLLEKHVGVFSFGFILLIFYASNAIIGIIRTFDRSIQEQKGFFLYQRWRAIRLTGILVLLVIASALVLIGQEQLTGLLKNLFHMRRRARLPWWNGIRWFIITGLLFYCVAMIYKFAPSVKKRWHLVSPGSLLATALILVTTIAFSSWVSLFASSNYNRVYGSIGTVLILMLLIYINSLILLIGFELNVSITYLTRKAEERNT